MKWALLCALSCTIWCGSFAQTTYTPVTQRYCDVKVTGVIKILGFESSSFEFRSHGDRYWIFILDGEVQYLNRPDLNKFLDRSDGSKVTSQTLHFLHFSYTSSESASGCSSSSTSCRKYKSTGGSDQYYIADGQGFVWSIFEEGLFGIKENEFSFQSYQYGTGLWSPSDFVSKSVDRDFTLTPSSSDFYGLCGTDPNPPPTPEPSPDPPTPEPSPEPPAPEPSSGTYNSVSSRMCSVKATGKFEFGGTTKSIEYQSIGGGYWKFLADGELQYLNRPDLGLLLDCSGNSCETKSSVPSFLDIEYTDYKTSSQCPAGSTSCKRYSAKDDESFVGDSEGHVWEYETKKYWSTYFSVGGVTLTFSDYSTSTKASWMPEDFTSTQMSSFSQPPSASEFFLSCPTGSGVSLQPLLIGMAAALWLLMHR